MTISNDVKRKTIIGTTVGGVAGATVALVSKPYLKHGEPRDVFLMECLRKHKDWKSIGKYNDKIETLLEDVKDIPGIEKIIADNKISLSEDILTGIRKCNSAEEAKVMISLCLENDQHHAGLKILREIRHSVKNWKNIKSELKTNAENFTKENREALQKAIKSMNIKCALLFGVIGATIAGVVTHVISKRNPKEK